MFLLRCMIAISLLVTVHYSYGMQDDFLQLMTKWLLIKETANQCIENKNKHMQAVEHKKIMLEDSIKKLQEKIKKYEYENKDEKVINELAIMIKECKDLDLVPDSVKEEYNILIKTYKGLLEMEKKSANDYYEWYKREQKENKELLEEDYKLRQEQRAKDNDYNRLNNENCNLKLKNKHLSSPSGQLDHAFSSCSKLNHPFIASGLGFIIYMLYHPHIAKPIFKQKLLLSLRDGLFATGLSSILVRKHKHFNGLVYLPTFMVFDVLCWKIAAWRNKPVEEQPIDEFGIVQKPESVEGVQEEPGVFDKAKSFACWFAKMFVTHGLLEITIFS